MTAAAVTLCFLLRTTQGREEVLLGMKKSGFGRGKMVGIGGHVEPGETTAEAICREVAEESGITIAQKNLELAGVIDFVFPDKPNWDMSATAYLCRVFEGEASESDEIAPQWFPVDELPLELMWQDAQHWLTEVLAGDTGHWRIEMNPDNESVASSTHS